jgi:hypothetical protein
MPLSREQMREFAVLQGVPDAAAFLADIHRRDAEEFADRPQDLIELCSDWREHHRIRSHCEQVETNIATKLKPRPERKERAGLSQEGAVEGASRLALASMLTRKLTLRHSADTDSVHASEAALEVSKVLPDWTLETQGVGSVCGSLRSWWMAWLEHAVRSGAPVCIGGTRGHRQADVGSRDRES